MDKICAIIEKTIHWANPIEHVPVVFASQVRSRMLTDPSPLLEFYFHAAGEDCRVSTQNCSRVVKPGELVLLNAHYGNQGTGGRNWRYWCVSFDVRKYALFDFLAEAPLLLAAPVRDPRAVRDHYADVVRDYGRKGGFSAIRLKTAVLRFLVTLWENVAPPSRDFPQYSPAIERVLERIHIRYSDQKLRLENLASAAHLSVDHFGRLFHSELGIAPMKYLTQYRLARACELMARGRLSVKQVAAEVGFRDPLHFSRVFTAHYGKSPSNYKSRPNTSS